MDRTTLTGPSAPFPVGNSDDFSLRFFSKPGFRNILKIKQVLRVSRWLSEKSRIFIYKFTGFEKKRTEKNAFFPGPVNTAVVRLHQKFKQTSDRPIKKNKFNKQTYPSLLCQDRIWSRNLYILQSRAN